MDNDNAFLGTGWGFPPQFDAATQSIVMASGDDDIRQSLALLLSTRPGERIMAPEYGCDIQGMVFEDLTLSTLTDIKSRIEQAILFFEPRIRLQAIAIDNPPAPDGTVLIRLDYTLIATNTRSNMVYPFYLREGTLVVAP
ncbi:MULTISPECIES: GPW/gp25 family protein [Dickeya]|uniref:GPW/gp25 family protein n=2 Tax=Dickeya chrysanthemi TaxID=556 RepID=C6CK39_DICC1|nr:MULTISPECIES: GPW/gp25 family protein [Dickeya]ACT05555.1 GPW/gp25 family protein [Dickeya chrysanthemi Ech1591]MBX9446312.1 GPW/gp25 family protein [Dickeya chrysanthemi]MCA7006721.1 GPW/gp25 family protein [Dickeya chrysanthemi]TYL42529.1 GPW/gp25 family protein [Dickeya sp. ws52]WJM84548.1 GPW/gp25 family protein [Dickeya chrysanthemi]